MELKSCTQVLSLAQKLTQRKKKSNKFSLEGFDFFVGFLKWKEFDEGTKNESWGCSVFMGT